ncbi:hypothetical protein [Phycicoccus sp. 3266]|uniref:hypothetical protein n=1 Tax=Phycicoccus sp. 3266 TaxID=2817751 RepID=UPI002859398D|nr:hypothetical protein [Phycicoccus sp. 3266]MDR6861995.1 hypothetical protein [Phycicoccus sp. 3266]
MAMITDVRDLELAAEHVRRCQRCRAVDRRGLRRIRGLMLCGLCELIAKARWRLQ